MDDMPAAARPIAFACSHCGRKFSVKPEFAGRQTYCPGCKETLIVPAPPADPTVTHVAGRPGGEPTAGRGDARTLPDVPELHGGAERYTMGPEIARGGMGAVLQATDCDIRREVAIKYLLDQSNTERKLRFIEEAQITGQLEHPNIVPIHELGHDAQGRVFFSMKMVRGQSLAQVLETLAASSHPPDDDHSLRRLLGVFVSVCNALAYAHSRGVVHRDLKPANIMIGDFGAVYVMDWGLAKVFQGEPDEPPMVLPMRLERQASGIPVARAVPAARESGTVVVTTRQERADLTQDGAILGTPVYMSPEQALGDIGAIDERSDIYSLGAILYEMLTLHPPVSKVGGHPAILKRVIEGQIAPPDLLHPDRARAGLIPPELAAIAMKALALAPADRYQSVEFLRRDIELFLDGRSVSAKEDSWAELFVKLVKRNRALSGVLAAALLVLATVGTAALVINLRARGDAEAAYQALQTEQQEKEARTRQAVPALIKAAQLEVQQRQFDQALGHVNLALEYDARNRTARLIKGQLLIARQQFKDAAAELEQCLAGKPDASVAELQRLCAEVRPNDEDKSALLQIAQNLVWQEYPTVAEEMLRQHGDSLAELRQDLLGRYRSRLEAAWPKLEGKLVPAGRPTPECTLALDEYGLHLKLVRDNVRDLSPVQGMVLNSIEIDCPELADLTALRGMPLRFVKLANLPATDLSALKGMALAGLERKNCHGTLDLTALRGMPLTRLMLENCSGVRELTALEDLPLTSLSIVSCHGLNRLSGLEKMPLKALTIRNCDSVRDLLPLKGLALTALDLSGCGIVHELMPLRTMPLVELNLSGTAVRDLEPLRGLPLTRLYLNHCAHVRDLTPLKGLPLQTLELNGCSRVVKLTPLAGMPLHFLALADTGIKDLAPLKGMPLIRITLGNCKELTSLAGLRGMPLVTLDLSGCSALADLSPLRGMPLGALNLTGCGEVVDLSPLRGIPLNVLALGGCRKVADLSPLQPDAVLTSIDLTDCAGLRNLNGLQAMRFHELRLTGCTSLVSLEGLKGSSVGTLTIAGCPQLENLRGLAGLQRLQQITIQNCPRLQDLSGLAGLPVKELNIAGSTVKDLTPLKGLPLEKLNLDRCLELHDLTPLAGMALVEIRLPPEVRAGLDGLRKMPGLQTINGQPAAFWKGK